MNARKVLIVGLGVLFALALVGIASAKDAAPANQITLHNQAIHGGILMVDSVTSDQSGWIVIYKRPGLDSDSIVGYAPVKKGLNQNVRVTLDEKLMKNVNELWARLHADNSPVGVFEWGLNNRPMNDLPVLENGKQVIVPFWASGESAPLSIKPEIAIKSQDIKHTNPIIADSVTTPVDGWLVIYRDQPGNSGNVVGYAPVYQGTNQNVKISIDTARVKDKPVLYAMLHTDQGTHGLFEWGPQYPAKADAPLYYEGHPVMVAFGTTTP